MSRPDVFLNAVGDIHILPKVLDAGSRFEPQTSDAVMKEKAETLQMEPLFV